MASASGAAYLESENQKQGAVVYRFFMDWEDDLVWGRDNVCA